MSAAGSGVIQRYDPGSGGTMYRDPDGDYVLYDDHLATIAALQAEREWRAISEAHKDGNEVVGRSEGRNPFFCHWGNGRWRDGAGYICYPIHFIAIPPFNPAPPVAAQGGGTP